MKRFKIKIRCVLLVFFLLLTQWMPAYSQDRTEGRADSIEISLLTCMPRPYIYSLYGHTAIRYKDNARGLDIVINYGVFSFDKPNFVLRFVFGLTDYEMGIEYFEYFKREYEQAGCGVIQQTLNLTDAEKMVISEAIDKNYLPENRVYRYNYFYDNCTTRARDILLDNIRGKVKYGCVKAEYPSFRELIRGYNSKHLWARLGNDLLLGVLADRHTTFAEQQFLPKNLSDNFASATIVGEDGSIRPLVGKTTWILPKVNDSGNDSFPLSPMASMGILAAVVVLVTLWESYRKGNYWILDLVLMLCSGLCGMVLFAMIFSQHPTVSLNLQILLLNPLNIIFLYNSIKTYRKGAVSLWTKVWTICLLIFVVGGIFQTYAEGMYFLALSLLFRNLVKIRLVANHIK